MAEPSPRETAAPSTGHEPPRRTVVLFGGTFDPPHRAHTELPALVLDRLGADELCYIPAGRSPFKLDHEQSDPRHRLAMLERALRGVKHATIDTGEIDCGDDEPSFTIDTVERLRNGRFADADLRLLIGTDQWFSFPLWKDAQRLAELAPLAVLARPPHGRHDAKRWLADEAPAYLRDTALIEAPAMDVSSSMLREMIRSGQDASAWIDSAVLDYIRRQGLYR